MNCKCLSGVDLKDSGVQSMGASFRPRGVVDNLDFGLWNLESTIKLSSFSLSPISSLPAKFPSINRWARMTSSNR